MIARVVKTAVVFVVGSSYATGLVVIAVLSVGTAFGVIHW